MRNMNPAKLYVYVKNYINFIWPIAKIISKIPKIGYKVNWSLLISDYSQTILKGADNKLLKEFAVLILLICSHQNMIIPKRLILFKSGLFRQDLRKLICITGITE